MAENHTNFCHAKIVGISTSSEKVWVQDIKLVYGDFVSLKGF